jgi:hypothetical protein
VELPRDTLKIQNLSSPLSTSDASLCGQKSRDYTIRSSKINIYASYQATFLASNFFSASAT